MFIINQGRWISFRSPSLGACVLNIFSSWMPPHCFRNNCDGNAVMYRRRTQWNEKFPWRNSSRKVRKRQCWSFRRQYTLNCLPCCGIGRWFRTSEVIIGNQSCRGFYILPLGLPQESWRFSSAVRVLSLSSMGQYLKDVLNLIVQDMVHAEKWELTELIRTDVTWRYSGIPWPFLVTIQTCLQLHT